MKFPFRRTILFYYRLLKFSSRYKDLSLTRRLSVVLDYYNLYKTKGLTADEYYEFEFENLGVENKFSIEMKKGKLTYEVIKNYYQPYDKIEENKTITVSQEITTQAKVNNIITQKVNVKNKSDYIENGLVEIKIPQGCSVIEDSLLNLK